MEKYHKKKNIIKVHMENYKNGTKMEQRKPKKTETKNKKRGTKKTTKHGTKLNKNVPDKLEGEVSTS